MQNGIHYYNFPWDDMGVPSMDVMLNITHVIAFIISRGGKVVVHCHAGLGRTGLVIACYFVYGKRCNPQLAIDEVRIHRPHSLQTKSQTKFVSQFAGYLSELRRTFRIRLRDPQINFLNYLDRQKKYLHGAEARHIRSVPKIIHEIAMMMQLLTELGQIPKVVFKDFCQALKDVRKPDADRIKRIQRQINSDKWDCLYEEMDSYVLGKLFSTWFWKLDSPFLSSDDLNTLMHAISWKDAFDKMPKPIRHTLRCIGSLASHVDLEKSLMEQLARQLVIILTQTKKKSLTSSENVHSSVNASGVVSDRALPPIKSQFGSYRLKLEKLKLASAENMELYGTFRMEKLFKKGQVVKTEEETTSLASEKDGKKVKENEEDDEDKVSEKKSMEFLGEDDTVIRKSHSSSPLRRSLDGFGYDPIDLSDSQLEDLERKRHDGPFGRKRRKKQKAKRLSIGKSPKKASELEIRHGFDAAVRLVLELMTDMRRDFLEDQRDVLLSREGEHKLIKSSGTDVPSSGDLGDDDDDDGEEEEVGEKAQHLHDEFEKEFEGSPSSSSREAHIRPGGRRVLPPVQPPLRGKLPLPHGGRNVIQPKEGKIAGKKSSTGECDHVDHAEEHKQEHEKERKEGEKEEEEEDGEIDILDTDDLREFDDYEDMASHSPPRLDQQAQMRPTKLQEETSTPRIQHVPTHESNVQGTSYWSMHDDRRHVESPISRTEDAVWSPRKTDSPAEGTNGRGPPFHRSHQRPPSIDVALSKSKNVPSSQYFPPIPTVERPSTAQIVREKMLHEKERLSGVDIISPTCELGEKEQSPEGSRLLMGEEDMCLLQPEEYFPSPSKGDHALGDGIFSPRTTDESIPFGSLEEEFQRDFGSPGANGSEHHHHYHYHRHHYHHSRMDAHGDGSMEDFEGSDQEDENDYENQREIGLFALDEEAKGNEKGRKVGDEDDGVDDGIEDDAEIVEEVMDERDRREIHQQTAFQRLPASARRVPSASLRTKHESGIMSSGDEVVEDVEDDVVDEDITLGDHEDATGESGETEALQVSLDDEPSIVEDIDDGTGECLFVARDSPHRKVDVYSYELPVTPQTARGVLSLQAEVTIGSPITQFEIGKDVISPMVEYYDHCSADEEDQASVNPTSKTLFGDDDDEHDEHDDVDEESRRFQISDRRILQHVDVDVDADDDDADDDRNTEETHSHLEGEESDSHEEGKEGESVDREPIVSMQDACDGHNEHNEDEEDEEDGGDANVSVIVLGDDDDSDHKEH
eukprot:TRINITY_DN720_c1_g1_i1.p1 TRINITY_DN720_c1_g1~~TRINITY_DN720_c1_g1_i1.p1  ORF type:complete len:1382 (+),score=487.06 TRINITY_DN720_c1_g1_i1:382-4146(+)